nr:sugar ABC transporter ATP-binding protein [Microbacterium bovistercoris]
MSIQPEARTATSAPPARLEVHDVTVTFGSNRVLRDVALEVRPGEIHGLIGQNGSGKSTLAKVLTGLYTPDPGARVLVDSEPLRLPVRPAESRAAGVAVVHQSLGLIDRMSVIENLRMGRLRARGLGRRIDWKRERAEAETVFDRLGRRVPFDVPVGALREEERATVAIARALQDATPGHGLIIFDESTRALGRRALEHFFAILDEIVATGTSVLLITHRLEEIIDAADRVTILRDGRVVESGREVAGMSEATLTTMMLGRGLVDLSSQGTAPAAASGSPVVVEHLAGLGVADLDLHVAAGEVLGLTGIAGSGYDDVPYLLSGASPAADGTITMRGTAVAARQLSPASAVAAGIALVPEGREHAGLAGSLSVAENAAFPQTSRSRRALLPYSAKDEKALVTGWIDQLDVRPPDPKSLVKNLSGGNAQKVLLAKWLATDPELLLLHEPTQAVDVGARHTIVAAIRKAASAGRAVIVAGSDENELSMLCDRILVFADGRVRDELTGRQSPDDIVAAIYAGGSRATLRDRIPRREEA